MAIQTKRAELTKAEAQSLLMPVGAVSVVGLDRVGITNDVFQVTTKAHGTYYIKFHTARWYADQPDTFFVVERECAVCDLLRRRGMPLPYRAWGDFTRTVVSRSVYICEELAGLPIPDALSRFPDQQAEILRTFGRYMRRLHDIEFSKSGILCYSHAYMADARPIPPVSSWDGSGMHHPEHFQRDALQILEAKTALLPAHLVPQLMALFQSITDVIRPDYFPPRFTVGNCHAWHFHVDQVKGTWTILGFYDFEAVSAGAPSIDLVELEITLTPSLKNSSWRKPFFEGYDVRPEFDGHKRRLLYYLLCEVGNPYTKQIPDLAWFNDRLERLINATDWSELEWFPEKETKKGTTTV